jgi:hypothetical protein
VLDRPAIAANRANMAKTAHRVRKVRAAITAKWDCAAYRDRSAKTGCPAYAVIRVRPASAAYRVSVANAVSAAHAANVGYPV